ncbi:hypothetical protein KC19_5G108500 [Ceratodon purpureus]|uniref:Uncharacterized protein n=2 Tax=Ceratodon purpureus TaxID=3225 RepID=A0A8T0I2L2_CERPU|nr:hypothetical protein KC19_5G108500 [Ceratodon purpureus]
MIQEDQKERMARSHAERAPAEQPLDGDEYVGDGSVDIRKRPSKKSASGQWKAAYFIMGVQLLERTAYYGIALNLVTYLVQELHEGTEESSTTIFNWAGVAWILPLLGGFLADAYTGRFWMIVVSIVIYLLGLILLSLSMSLNRLRPPPCPTRVNCTPATQTQENVFYLALYVVAIGIGGVTPCLSPFGADQFNEDDEKEKQMKHSFFNYYGLAVAGGSVVALSVLVYVQETVAWGWGYAVPAFGLGIAFVLFISGLPKYRHQPPTGSPLTEIAQVFTAAILNAKVDVPADPGMLHDAKVQGKRNVLHTNSLRFLDKAAVIRRRDFIPSIQADPLDPEKRTSLKVSPWRLCGVAQVEEVKLLVRVMPIWTFSLMFMVHITQITSFFLRQGLSMDLSMGPNFKIPAASLTIFNSLTAILCIPLYNEYFVPLMRRITGNERGISMLQRIGTGLVLTTVAMIVAAVVENERLEVVREHGLEDQPAVAVPMSAFWLLPQYMIFGVSEVFVMIGQYEFFYDQAPDDMQSIGTALYMSNTGVAHFLCTAILKIVVSVTSNGGRSGWIVNNLNRCRIDKYYWMLAALGAANFVCYVVVARWYTYKKAVRQY